MLLTLGNYLSIHFSVFFLALLSTADCERLYDGDDCKMKGGESGICVLASKCTSIMNAIECGIMTAADPVNCGFSKSEELICCPNDNKIDTICCNCKGDHNSQSTTIRYPSQPKTSPSAPSKTSSSASTTVQNQRFDSKRLRPAVLACQEIERKSSAFLVPNIINGNETALGEFPHMAAIGFADSEDDKNKKYNYRCGGTLIDKKFVLSAAHCFLSRDADAAKVVLLGVNDMANKEELENAVMVPIKHIYIHPDYSSLRKYSDIALIRLEHEVEPTEFIVPTCLYTADADPPKTAGIFATGWGVTDTRTRATSNKLLKAQLEISPLKGCNNSYVQTGLSLGLKESQLCAFDPKSDTCAGDSGGPLSLLLDREKRQFRVIGVTSTGFGCGSSIPGLYTRVSSFLDYIEDIVWPDLKP